MRPVQRRLQRFEAGQPLRQIAHAHRPAKAQHHPHHNHGGEKVPQQKPVAAFKISVGAGALIGRDPGQISIHRGFNIKRLRSSATSTRRRHAGRSSLRVRRRSHPGREQNGETKDCQKKHGRKPCSLGPVHAASGGGNHAPRRGILSRTQAFAIIEVAASHTRIAPLAQLDRASGYEPEGREFESLRAHHTFSDLEFLPTIRPRIVRVLSVTGENQTRSLTERDARNARGVLNKKLAKPGWNRSEFGHQSGFAAEEGEGRVTEVGVVTGGSLGSQATTFRSVSKATRFPRATVPSNPDRPEG